MALLVHGGYAAVTVTAGSAKTANLIGQALKASPTFESKQVVITPWDGGDSYAVHVLTPEGERALDDLHAKIREELDAKDRHRRGRLGKSFGHRYKPRRSKRSVPAPVA